MVMEKKSSMTFILNYIASSEQTKYELMRNKNVTLDFFKFKTSSSAVVVELGAVGFQWSYN